jgi:hypothetical protein
LIYSRWRPDRGGYDYFETPERFGLGDDLPTPVLPSGSSIGVSSVLAGRKPPQGAVPAGSGEVARGMVMPTSRAGLMGLGVLNGFSGWVLVGLGALGGFVGARLWKK